MSEQDFLNLGPLENKYFQGLRAGYVGANAESQYWDPPQPKENKFDLFDPLDKPPSSPSEVYGEGLLRGAAYGVNKAVHQALGSEAGLRPGKNVTRWGDDADTAQYVRGVFEGAEGVTKGIEVSALLNEPAIKEVVPEIALTELYGNFDSIHDARISGGVTRQDLETYAKNCGEGDTLKKLVVDYAIEHFDKIRQLDGDKPGITKSALENGLKMFGAAESTKVDLLTKKGPDEDVLHFLDANFDKIRNPKFTGISQFDLQRYFSGDCKFEPKQKVFEEFDQIRNLNQSDGDSDYHYLWLARGNSDDITRSDVSTGLASIANDRASLKQVQSLFDDWAK